MAKENTVVPSWLVGDGGALFMDSYNILPVTSNWSEFWIEKKAKKLGKIPVLGSYDDLPELAKPSQVEKVIVAIPSRP